MTPLNLGQSELELRPQSRTLTLFIDCISSNQTHRIKKDTASPNMNTPMKASPDCQRFNEPDTKDNPREDAVLASNAAKDETDVAQTTKKNSDENSDLLSNSEQIDKSIGKSKKLGTEDAASNKLPDQTFLKRLAADVVMTKIYLNRSSMNRL
ncbi:hypothetical protein PTNB73_05240 [Pyrenophora teres f. teres]|nr:hypothetical protein PTNB85_04259 [Pyrenophora teres f. teres]KAE8864356.1 hypothetical protein PTNB29_04320 [Pyrenophora teres f. teres]KAE8867146.1 hypothetical protein PTNB73_05240 [Pyrenophora teres f. teres]